MEGYGATETAGVASLQFPGDPRPGNSGPPLPCSIFKLEDIPELNISVKRDRRGEVCVFNSKNCQWIILNNQFRIIRS